MIIMIIMEVLLGSSVALENDQRTFPNFVGKLAGESGKACMCGTKSCQPGRDRVVTGWDNWHAGVSGVVHRDGTSNKTLSTGF